MNNFLYNDIYIGQSETFKKNLSSKDIDVFSKISGDTNPLHIDPAYAKEKGFKENISHGLLASSFFSTLVGIYLPGKYALLHTIDISFHKPIFPNSILSIYGEVTNKHDAFKIIEIKASISANKSTMIKAKIRVGFHE